MRYMSVDDAASEAFRYTIEKGLYYLIEQALVAFEGRIELIEELDEVH